MLVFVDDIRIFSNCWLGMISAAPSLVQVESSTRQRVTSLTSSRQETNVLPTTDHHNMVKLTEEMIQARTRVSDLSSVRKLSCWGSNLDDVSVVRRLRNVEMIALRFDDTGYRQQDYFLQPEWYRDALRLSILSQSSRIIFTRESDLLPEGNLVAERLVSPEEPLAGGEPLC